MTAIIINTFREKIRDKALYITGIIGIIIMLILTSGSGLSVNGEKLVNFDQLVPVGMAVINLTGNILAIMISLNTIPKEFERKTTHLVLVRGIKHWQYMFSLTVGNILSSLGAMIMLYGSLIVFCILKGKIMLIPSAIGCIAILSLNTIVLSAIISVISIKVPVFINGFIGVIIYFIGVFHNLIMTAASAVKGGAGGLLKIILSLTPNFADIQTQGSNLLLNRKIDFYPIVLQLLFIYVILSFTFFLSRKEV